MSLLTKEYRRRLGAILFASTYFADAKHSRYVHKTKKRKQKGLGFRVLRKTRNPSAMIRVLSPLSSLFSSISPVLASLSLSQYSFLSLSLSLSLSGFFIWVFFRLGISHVMAVQTWRLGSSVFGTISAISVRAFFSLISFCFSLLLWILCLRVVLVQQVMGVGHVPCLGCPVVFQRWWLSLSLSPRSRYSFFLGWIWVLDAELLFCFCFCCNIG